MTYWNVKTDKMLNLSAAPAYKRWAPGNYESLSEEGYQGDDLVSSEVIYVGSCDAMSGIKDISQRWQVLHHTSTHPDQPFIVIGSISAGLPSMIRRIYSYIQNYGAPKIIYLTIPRFDSYEYVNSSGICIPLSDRYITAQFSLENALVNEDDYKVWVDQLAASIQRVNPHQMLYLIQERFAFIETICLAYNITLQWTFNPSDGATLILDRYISCFEHISCFMKESFVGLPQIRDLWIDRSVGPATHRSIYEQFIAPEPWDYGQFCRQSAYNMEWLKEKHGAKLIGQDT